jgi:hypothetical protein
MVMAHREDIFDCEIGWFCQTDCCIPPSIQADPLRFSILLTEQIFGIPCQLR